MAYKLNITDQANDLLDDIVYYLLFRLKTKQGAEHLLDALDQIYMRLEENPLQFPLCRDLLLSNRGFREAVVPQMDYIVIFCVQDDTVSVVGIFHQLENYIRRI